MGNARGRATVGRLPGPDLLQSSRLSLTSLTTYYIHTSSPVCIAHIHTFADLPRVRRPPATRRCLEIEQSHESTQHIEPSSPQEECWRQWAHAFWHMVRTQRRCTRHRWA